MRYNILFGGKAGQGPNILTHVLSEALVSLGYYVFYSRDYQSLIRGGHNFNVLTFSDEKVFSNDSKIDIMIAIDENTEKIHAPELKKNGIILNGKYSNMYFAGKLFKTLGLDFGVLDERLKILKKRYDENITEAKKGYDEGEKKIDLVKVEKKSENYFLDGNDGVCAGAIAGGLDFYCAYPMTPSTSVLGKLAGKQVENNYLVVELENEIAVANTAVGAAITGAKAMVGSSGGGFDLMTETISMIGVAKIPMVLFLAQRPGPGSGVATYNAQGDLNMARFCGHGEFQRLVLAPGDPKEAEELTSEAFYFSQKYKVPVIVISDKHLGESFYTMSEKAKNTKSKKLTSWDRYNSYEKDAIGSATEDSKIIETNIVSRLKDGYEIEKEAMADFSCYNVYGNKNSKNVVVSWGSPKGAIIDATKDLDCKFVQIKYIEPFPKNVLKELRDKNLILVENNTTGPLAGIIAEKLQIVIPDKNKILRMDGRPFLADELKNEIKRRMK